MTRVCSGQHAHRQEVWRHLAAPMPYYARRPLVGVPQAVTTVIVFTRHLLVLGVDIQVRATHSNEASGFRPVCLDVVLDDVPYL